MENFEFQVINHIICKLIDYKIFFFISQIDKDNENCKEKLNREFNFTDKLF